jgi:hypothetical protein
MTTYTDYTNYFKGIAEQFLGHSENEKHFFRKGLDEFLNGLSTDVNYPALLLDNYDFSFSDNGADNVMTPITAAFMIIDHVKDIGDYDLIDQVMDSTKEIVGLIYNQIRRDIAPPQHIFLNEANMSNVRVSPLFNKADGNWGWFVTVEISSYHNTSL